MKQSDRFTHLSRENRAFSMPNSDFDSFLSNDFVGV